MPSILNLKFKGNKSFVPFSNLSDADSLTMTWKVCTKVASFLEQGQRLENLSWRLWHLQNLMVDTDNAKSKRDFKKLSKCMGDKLDKEKGRSIEELQAPGFKRNHSTELIQQRAAEKEREREANQNGRPGTIHRMQFTFSVDQPAPPTAATVSVKKPDLKPSPEFRDNALKRGRPSTRSTAAKVDDTNGDHNDKDQPLTQRGRRPAVATNNSRATATSDDIYQSASLRFPSLFSNDFGPAALLYPTPTVTNTMTYGEGVVSGSSTNSDGFSIVRPTIELPLDDLISTDGAPSWISSFGSMIDVRVENHDGQDDVEMESVEREMSYPTSTSSGRTPSSDDDEVLTSTAVLRNVPPLSIPAEDVVPRTITPTRLAPPNSNGTPTTNGNGKRPSLSVRTQSSSRSAGPSATPVNGGASAQQNNSAPGGVKAECSNCGATHTPLWRRGLNDELNCNACGLYCKLHKRPRPKSMRNNHGEGRAQNVPRQDAQEVAAQCYNCHTTATPLWRKDDEGKTVCNACGLYYKLHGSARPISMKSDVIRKRARHDARRVGSGPSETPSASPGASRRASPTMEATPTLAPDSTTQMFNGHEEVEYRTSMQSELMGALGNTTSQNSSYSSTFFGSSYSFPGPYHPDYLAQTYSVPADALPFSGDYSDMDNTVTETRVSKRRRMSSDSASEPPSSATSFGSYADSYTSPTSSSSQSQRSSLDFAYNPYSSYNMMRGNNSSSLWHPPMLPPDNSTNSPCYVHPPMLPSDNSPNMFLHGQSLQHDDADNLFAAYLHPPRLLPDSPSMNGLQLHPPMLPNEWKSSEWKTDYYDAPMITYG
ncbi:uncharacterized protein LAESUDRAFT_745783 [Laetiporus sulphureus 93-53]|uniref:GATA-type domain-containing protein n=1 Tax=Laetiporus sulphureus 93-53 TaxID=1314785 RepID=A0A165BAL0_9APHY|nr:uncharacterized protein LAESUDRAFT_745783 [Laetiporus sulphureus 93-53]KZT00625.1 hypothetical protein LAESUDRAFT_745783 [Laetiporus sulphureus 93-53]